MSTIKDNQTIFQRNGKWFKTYNLFNNRGEFIRTITVEIAK